MASPFGLFPDSLEVVSGDNYAIRQSAYRLSMIRQLCTHVVYEHKCYACIYVRTCTVHMW